MPRLELSHSAFADLEPQDSSTLLLSEPIGALSDALDITEGQPKGHCVRCCWIGMHIGCTFGLNAHDLWELYYTLLLKDLGCSSNTARICDLYLADDLAFKCDFKLVGDSLPQMLRFVFTHTGVDAGLGQRFGAVMNIMQNGPQIARELVETRCQRGSDIARQLRFRDPVANGIGSLDEHWNGHGKPLGLQGIAIPLYARIALVSACTVFGFLSMNGCGAYRQAAGIGPLNIMSHEVGTALDPLCFEALRSVLQAG